MEGEERDPDGQQDLDEGQLVLEPQEASELVRRRNKKIEIFEDSEQSEMQRDRDPEDGLPPPLVRRRIDQLPGEIAEHRARGEQKTETPIPLRVEVITGDDQHRLFRREAGVQHRHRCRDDQEKQQESEGWEQHQRSDHRMTREKRQFLGK